MPMNNSQLLKKNCVKAKYYKEFVCKTEYYTMS